MNEEDIKKRLVGSVVVVLSIVIFVPILLDSSKPNSDQTNTLEVPSSSEFSLQSKSDDISPDEFSSEKSEKNQIHPISGESDSNTASKNNEPEIIDEVVDEILEEQKARNKVDSFEDSLKELESKISGRLKTESDIEKKSLGLVEWLLQVGSFSDRKNAENFASRLKKGFFEAYTIDIGDESGKFYKVRIGPYKKRIEAKNDLVKIEKSYGVKGFLVKVTP